MRRLRRFLGCTRGATAIEYALIAAIVSIAAIVAIGQLGNSISNNFEETGNKIAG